MHLFLLYYSCYRKSAKSLFWSSSFHRVVSFYKSYPVVLKSQQKQYSLFSASLDLVTTITIKPIDLHQARKVIIKASYQVVLVVHVMDPPRGRFTVKLTKLKLQGLLLA